MYMYLFKLYIRPNFTKSVDNKMNKFHYLSIKCA